MSRNFLAPVIAAGLVLLATWVGHRIVKRHGGIRSLGPVGRAGVLGAVGGALTAICLGAVLVSGSTATTRVGEVFKTVPLPTVEPGGLTSVLFQNSPSNGLEIYVQQGILSYIVCLATPDQIAYGSCSTAKTTLIRTRPEDDIRVLRIVRFHGPEDEIAKSSPTMEEADATAAWKWERLVNNPEWLEKYLTQ